MKLSKFAAAVLGASAIALLTSSAKAADSVDFVGAGSSAQFSTFTHAFYDQGYTTHYSLGSSSTFTISDPADAAEPAQVAIYWRGAPGSYSIAVYYQVDSTVGVRSFFNSDTVVCPTVNTGLAAGANKGYPGNSDVAGTAIPNEILAAINGSIVNAGATDITPEDARVATERCFALGYSTTIPIKSSVSSTSLATPVRFNLSARTFTLTSLGADPIVVFINNGPTFSGLSGSNLNINSFTLAGYLSGQLNLTSDLTLASGAVQKPVHTYIREPLSGTYNTLEYTNPESLAKLSFTGGRQSGSTAASGGQEFAVDPTANNPLNEPVTGSAADPAAVANSGRKRAIGTGELIKAVAADTTDALGYAFWSTGNFSTGNGGANLRYLTVDGADPIQDSYTGGSVTSPTVSFRNIVNGGYPLWSLLRVVTDKITPATVSAIVNQAQNEDGGSDYANAKTLRVFRSYHQTPYTVGTVTNGNIGSPAKGGDVGGAVFSINDDVDYDNDFGVDLTNIRQ